MTEPHGKSPVKRELNVLASFALLFVRGVSLWLLIPLGAIFWVAALPWVLRHSTSFGQFLGWLDLNYCIALERGPSNPNGGLENMRHQMSEARYQSAGGDF